MQVKNFLSWFIERTASLKPFFVAVAFSPWLIILYVVISNYSKSLNQNDLYVISSFIEWLGLAYSIFMAVVLVNAWSHFDTVEREFEREADAISTLHQQIERVLFIILIGRIDY